MAGGLLAGYGACGAVGARFVYPTAEKFARLFVTDLASVSAGTSMRYETPTGATLTVTRLAANGTADDFIALSSTCPHLGCQVHWQPDEKQFFCPCHNGTFDAQGAPTGGPPKADNTPLLRYRLVVDEGLLFIEIPERELA